MDKLIHKSKKRSEEKYVYLRKMKEEIVKKKKRSSKGDIFSLIYIYEFIHQSVNCEMLLQKILFLVLVYTVYLIIDSFSNADSNYKLKIDMNSVTFHHNKTNNPESYL